MIIDIHECENGELSYDEKITRIRYFGSLEGFTTNKIIEMLMEEAREYFLLNPVYPFEPSDSETSVNPKRKSFERFTSYKQKRTKSRKI